MRKIDGMDRYAISATQKAVKRKARKVRFPAAIMGERAIYCHRCLKGHHEVERIFWDAYISICSECVENLSIFLRNLRDEEKQRD